MARFVLFLLLLPTLAFAAEAPIKSVTASSTEKPQPGGINYEAENMTEPTGFTYWAEGDGSAGLGTRIDVKFPKTFKLTGFAIWNGSQSDADTWKNSNRIKSLEFEFKAGTFGDPTKEMVALDDKVGRTSYTFAEPREADQLKMFIREVYSGEAYNETAISFVQFQVAGAEEFIYATKTSASSEADGFAARAATDGLIDTPWCVAEGKGKNETLTITLPAGSKVKGLVGRFGVNIDGEWDKNARPKSMKVAIGGKTLDWAVEDVQKEQTLDLGGAVEASTVTITLTGVQKGRIYKDPCISEIHFQTAD